MTMNTSERTAKRLPACFDCSDIIEEKKSMEVGDLTKSYFRDKADEPSKDAKQPLYRNTVSNEPGSLPDKGHTMTTQQPTQQQYCDSKDKPVLEKALPPWHAVAFISTIMTTCTHHCRNTVDSIDQVAVLETFTHRIFPQYLSLKAMGWIRLAIATSIWVVFYSTVTSEGWIQTTHYPKGSQLQSGVKIAMRGSRTLFPFTSWCWILLGISYTNHALLALAVAYQGHDWVLQYTEASPWILRGILLTWETTAPCAFLVSSVIRYAIWDMVKKGPGSTVHLKHIRNMFCHNLNSVFVLTEVALMGGLPVRLEEMYCGPFLGCVYVLMAWNLTGFWTHKKFGPHYLYFFLDTTLGYTTTLALMALCSTLCLFYFILAWAQEGLNSMADVILLDDFPPLLLACHVTFVLGISSLVCRFND